MRRIATLAGLVGLVLVCAQGAHADVTIDTVTVGDPGNVDDTHGDGYGGVAYRYNIGKFEVTNSQYAEFLNAVASVGDQYGLYNFNMGGGGWNDIGGISRSGSGTSGDPWVYAVRTNRGNRPVNYVSWYDALRFANWMHNGQPTGAQGAPTTEDGSYDLSLGASVVRKSGSKVFLPNEDEWYKAAYYKGGNTNAGYWDYPTQSDGDAYPMAEPPPGTEMAIGSANWYNDMGPFWYVDPTYYTTEVGAYDAKPSDSAYGTFDQAGNLLEWNEADWFGDGSARGVRGGWFDFLGDHLMAAGSRSAEYPDREDYYIGFRVAGLPVLVVGDLNCDGWVNNGDIDAFVFALSYPELYADEYPGCDIMLGDINGDGWMNNGDIDAFVALLAE